MKMERNKGEEYEMHKQKANAWRARYDDALRVAVSDPKITKQSLMDLIWEKGFLEHMSPTDGEERRAREALGKGVWDRNDNEMYARILYSTLNTKMTAENNATMVSGYATQSLLQAFVEMQSGESTTFSDYLPELKSGKEKNPVVVMANAIIERAQRELAERGGDAVIVPIGSEGAVDGVAVRVIGYSGVGEIVVEPIRLEDGFFLKSRSIVPTEVDPNEFRPPNAKE